MANNTKGMGNNGSFFWFQGVVESRIDPLKLGRVRVRILGIHTEDKNQIPTEHLPFAYPLQPITSAAMNGLGETPLGPVEGSWVFGFFRDGESCQEPVIIGTFGGVPPEYPYPKSQRIGFLDPRTDLSDRPRKWKIKTYPNDGNGAVLTPETPTPPTGESYPRSQHPYGAVVGENDMNRLARNEKISDTIVLLKRETIVTGIPVADGTTWDEPTTPYDAVYPYNHVQESESGHIFEVDDTPGNERLHTYHRSGTFEETYADGIRVEKIVGNSYRIYMEETYAYHENRVNITIDGPFNILVRNNAKISVTGNVDVEVGGDYNLTVGGNYTVSTKGTSIVQSEGDATFKSGSSTTIGAGSSVSLKGSSVSSYPPVDKAYNSQKTQTSNIPFITNPSAAQSVSVTAPSNTSVTRIWPRAIPTYPIQAHP